MYSKPQAQTLKRVEDAEEKEDNVRERPKVQEGQTPSCPKQAAEAPDAEKSHTILPPFIPDADLPIDQDEHHNARGYQDDQGCHTGEVVGQQGLFGIFHPAPGKKRIYSEKEKQVTSKRDK